MCEGVLTLLQLLLLSLGLALLVKVQSKHGEDDDHGDSDHRDGDRHSSLAAILISHSPFIVFTIQAGTRKAHFDDDPVSALDSEPGISPDEVEAGGRFGVPVVLGSSTPSVAVTG